MLPPSIAAPAGIAVYAVQKRAEKRRKQAAANAFSAKYGLVDDLPTMQSSIAQAEAELKAINSQKVKGAGEKRVQKRNSTELAKWISTMKAHAKDLKVGIDMASTNLAPVTVAPPQAAVAAEQPQTTVSSEPVPHLPIKVAPEQAEASPGAAAESQMGQNMATPTKGGPNWMAIGIVAIGALLLINAMKNK